MEKARIGLIGCGLFGESHLQAFRSVRSGEVAAVYDTDRERAEQRAKDFGIPKVCRSLDEICSLPEVDAIDVVTPEESHVEPVVTAFAAGKHVFVEKPLATDLGDCDRIIGAGRAAGRALMAGHLLRFETKYAMLKDEVASGRLGKVASMHARRNRRKSLLPRYGRTHPAIENCIHDIDLMLWYLDEPVKRVRGYGRKATGSKHHDTFWGVLEFSGGALGIVETVWLVPEASGILLDDAFQLIGDRGVGNIRLVPEAISFWRDEGYDAPDFSYDPRVANSARGALRDQMEYFCDCVVEGRTPEMGRPEDAKRAVQLALALIESSLQEKDVEIA
jgi:predicted dehydrogenase